MKCFFFKTKSKSNSAPDLQNQKKRNPELDRTSKSTSSLQKSHNLRVFTSEELVEATNGFNRTLKIGEGGFGSVYKGTISPQDGLGDPIVVAIKKLNTLGFQVHLVRLLLLLLLLSH